MRHFGSTLILLFLSTVTAPSIALAQTNPASLKGLTEVVFTVSSFGSNAQPALAQMILKTDLREAGFRLLSEDEAGPATPHLELVMDRACKASTCGFSVRLELTQQVRLARDPHVETTAVTWADGYQDAIDKSNLSDLMDKYDTDAQSLMKLFLADYAAANGKK